MCDVIMDLKAVDQKFTMSTSGKSATLHCAFSGAYKGAHFVDVELMLARRGCPPGKSLNGYLAELHTGLKAGQRIIRVRGKLRCLQYQQRDNGEEIQQYQIYADNVLLTDEEYPEFSSIVMEGVVKATSFTDIVKISGNETRAVFWLWSEPDGSYDRETYLSLLAKAYGEVAETAGRMQIRETSNLLVSGMLQATSYGVLSIKLHTLRFPKHKRSKEENSNA